jgi:hypothetical protein
MTQKHDPAPRNVRQRRAYHENREKVLAYQRAYRKAHPEKVRMWNRRYYHTHPEQARAYRRAYYHRKKLATIRAILALRQKDAA